MSSGGLHQLEEMQPPPRTAPPGACGTPPPPTSGGSNAFRRNRPHKHGALAPNAASTQHSQPLTDPFAFGRQGSPSAGVSNQTPPLNNSPLPMQAPLAAGFNQTGPPQGPPSGAQVPIAGPLHTFFTPHPGPSGPPLPSNPPSGEPGYFSSQEPMPYIAQLPNSVPPFSSSTMHAPPAAATPPVQSMPLFQPTPPAPSHSGPDHGSRPPSVQNYFQPTSDTPQPFHAHPQAQAPPPALLPHHGQFQSHTQNHSQSAVPNVGDPAISQQQNSHFSAQSYFSQTGGASDPWFNQVPQDPLHRSCPLPYTVPSADPGTLTMFFHGNDVENEETLSGEGHVNGVSHPPQGREVNETIKPGLNEPTNVKVTAGPCDSVENLECVPNQEVLPIESPLSHAYEVGPNLETPDSSRPARSASVSSSYSNVSHSSGHAPHSSSHPPRRHQGVVGTFIQQESPRPPDTPASHPSGGGYFEQIDSAPAPELSPTFPTPSPPKPVGVFQASANSSFEPVRSHSVGVRPAEVDRARMVMEKGGVDTLPGNLEQPPDNMETIYFPGGQDRRPSSRAQGSRRPCDSPATTLWAQSDAASLGANILLAPAAPPLPATIASSCKPSTEVIQPPEDGALDLQLPRAHPQPHSENLENPPDSAPQASLGYASLLVSTPPTEALHQPVLIATPSSNCTVISPQMPVQTTNQMSPKETNVPVQPPTQAQVASQLPQGSHSANHPPPLFSQTPISFHPPSSQSLLNLAQEGQDAPLPVHPAQSTTLKAQSPRSDCQSLPPSNSQIPSSASVINQNHRSNYELLDFSMHQAQSINPAPSHSAPAPVNNAAGFYLQVTKDAQQGAQADSESSLQPTTLNPPRAPSNQSSNGSSGLSNPAHPASQYQPPPQTTPVSQTTPSSTYPPQSGNSAGTHDPQRPPSALGGQHGYGAPPPMPPGPGFGSYYAEYQDGRHPFPPPYPHMDPRAQNYYQVFSFLSKFPSFT